MTIDLGPQSTSDNQFTAACRLLQSEYRAKVLQQPYGAGPTKNSARKYGNMLVNGETTGANFISQAAFAFAREKVAAKKTNKYLTIDEFRLFNNMLSSMPMCFNLFADLRELQIKRPKECNRIAKLLFAQIPWLDTVTEIDVEFIPVPIADHTNDKSAFDAMLMVRDLDGKQGLISIETKYTDLLGSNIASDSKIKDEIVRKAGFFTPDYAKSLAEKGYKQIHRNFILTYAYAQKHGCEHFANVIISPEQDKLSVLEIGEMVGNMTKFRESILKINLEDFVSRGRACGDTVLQDVMTRFYKRYLAF